MAKSLIITAIFLLALYYGTGGFLILENVSKYNKAITLTSKPVSYNGVTLKNKEVMETCVEEGHITYFYPYYDYIPMALNFIITAICFGIIGAIGKTINNTIKDKSVFHQNNNLLLIPIQGGIIGLIILGISYTIPVLLTSESVSLKPITVVFLSLFGGIKYETFYEWLIKSIENTVFKSE